MIIQQKNIAESVEKYMTNYMAGIYESHWLRRLYPNIVQGGKR